MSIFKFGNFMSVPPIIGGDNEVEKKPSQFEKLKGYHKDLSEKFLSLLKKLNIKVAELNDLDYIGERVEDLENDNEDCKFLDLEVQKQDKNLSLRTVAQIDPNHDANRKKNYNEWDLTPQEETERWLNREILVAEKISKFYQGDEVILADTVIESSRDFEGGGAFVLKEIRNQERDWEDYSENEGRALARALINLQDNLQATEMVNEIMAEEGIKTKLELEQKIFEDYFDHFDGYMENSECILNDLGDDELAEKFRLKMEGFRGVIEDKQLKEGEYSLSHGGINLESVIYSQDAKQAFLSDWQRPGTTQNRELSLIYDLGDAMQDALEKLDFSQAQEFIQGLENEIKSAYDSDVSEAVISLTKLRSFSMILNDCNDEVREFLEVELSNI